MIEHKKFELKHILSLDVLVYFFIILYIIILSFLAFGRHDALKSYLHDIGFYTQIVYNTSEGKLFEGTIIGNGEPYNGLGYHFSPLLVFFVPFFLISSSPKIILFFSTVFLAISGLPIFWLAKKILKSPAIAFVFILAYLFNPILHNSNLYDFNAVVMAVPLLTFAFYFMLNKRYWLFAAFSFLAILAKEEMSLFVLMFGFFLIFFSKKYKLGTLIIVFSLFAFFTINQYFIPAASGSMAHSMIAAKESFVSRYNWLGDTLREVITTVITKPFFVLRNILTTDRLNYLLYLALPLAFLPFFSGVSMIILPALAINLLSTNAMMYDVFFYHSAAIIPFLFIASIFSLKNLFKEDRYWFVMRLILIFTFIANLLFGVTPLSLKYSFSDYVPSDNALLVNEIKKLVPQKFSLSAQHNLGPHFSEREKIYVFPRQAHESDYVLVDLFDPYWENPRQVFTFSYGLQINVKDWIREIEKMFADKNYGIIYYEDGYFLFKRGANGNLREAALKDFQARKKLFIINPSPNF